MICSSACFRASAQRCHNSWVGRKGLPAIQAGVLRGERQRCNAVHLISIRDATVVFSPRRLLRVAKEVRACDVMVDADSYALMPMPLDRVRRLVEGPAQVAGLNVEKGLAEAIARDVESPEALPLLAHTLWLLYRRCSDNKKLSLAEYRSLGDSERHLNPIQNSVRQVADQVIAGLKPADAELAGLRDAFVPHLMRVRLDDGK
jgi:hypothetical protein